MQKAFNKSLNDYDLGDCEDSTSVLTSKLIYFRNGNQTGFSIDVCIMARDEKDNYHKLIHKKTGFASCDEYYWNIVPNSAKVKKKADDIKKHGKWELVRQQYERIKNKYLSRNDLNHPSFICYIEAINNVYNSRKHWQRK